MLSICNFFFANAYLMNMILYDSIINKQIKMFIYSNVDTRFNNFGITTIRWDQGLWNVKFSWGRNFEGF